MQFANTKATTYNDTVVRQFAIMTVVWGVIGMLVGVIVAAQLAWPALNMDIQGQVGRTPQALECVAGHIVQSGTALAANSP